MRNSVILVAAGSLLLGAATVPSVGPATEPAVVPAVMAIVGRLGKPVALFNGKDLSGWAWHAQAAGDKSEEAFMVKEGNLHVSARPTGFIDTEKAYRNFVLTVEERHVTRGNGGLFICIAGEEKVWPDAIQIQGNFGKVGDLINQNSGMKKMTTDPARTAVSGKDVVVTRLHANAEKAVGEWNRVVITMENGNLAVTVNGVVQNTAKDVTPDAGKIGIQAEGAEMEFRKIELVPIE